MNSLIFKNQPDLETVTFENMTSQHAEGVMSIFNFYAINSFSAYPEKMLPVEFFKHFLEMTKGYPAYVIKIDENIAGFCFLRAYNPFPVFAKTAEISYFIDNRHLRKGLGVKCLQKLEEDAANMGISSLLASITSENKESISFHKKNGFIEYGCLPSVGLKFGKAFDIIWMGKQIQKS